MGDIGRLGPRQVQLLRETEKLTMERLGLLVLVGLVLFVRSGETKDWRQKQTRYQREIRHKEGESSWRLGQDRHRSHHDNGYMYRGLETKQDSHQYPDVHPRVGSGRKNFQDLSSGYNHKQEHSHTHEHRQGHKHEHTHEQSHSHSHNHTHTADHTHDHEHVHHHKHNHIHDATEEHEHSHSHRHGHLHSGYDNRRQSYERLAVDHTKDFLKDYMRGTYNRLTGY